MSDIDIRKDGRAGRITLQRPKALNALTYDMIRAIEAALDDWTADGGIDLLMLDAVGDRAFCAGGDIAEMYATGTAGDFGYGRQFWRDEYRMNRKMFRFPKPVVTFLQGFTMGGGVGVGCHGSHRIVGDTSKVAMPECGIGLVPDVGGSLILARAPGRLGEYLGTTCHRMSAGDALHAGFADYYLPEDRWDALKQDLARTGDPAEVDRAALPAPDSALARDQPRIDAQFGGERLIDILNALRTKDSSENAADLAAIDRNAPLSMACTVEMLHRLRGSGATIDRALDLEYRFTWRAMQHGDFLEGIRAAIIDKDKQPRWRHRLDAVPAVAVSQMLMPLGEDALNWEDTA